MLAPGSLTALPGDAATGATLVDVAYIVSFTGSTGVGRSVVASAWLPFGTMGDSSSGSREPGTAGLDFLPTTRTVSISARP